MIRALRITRLSVVLLVLLGARRGAIRVQAMAADATREALRR